MSDPFWRSKAYTKLRAELRAQWQALDTPCHICGQPIDWDAPPNTPNSFELDHIKPRATHPHLALERSNLAPAMSSCNRSKGARAPRPSMGEQSEAW